MVLAVGLNIHTAIFMKKVYGKNWLASTKYMQSECSVPSNLFILCSSAELLYSLT
jgi:hypothetical protein